MNSYSFLISSISGSYIRSVWSQILRKEIIYLNGVF